MLTPTQIRDYRFQSAGRGLYKSDEVDEIYSRVIASYEQMFKENSELIKRVSMLAEKVEEYRRDEELIQKTLLVAQRKADEIEDESEKTAAARISKAEERAQEIEAAAEKQSKEKIDAAQARADRIRAEAEEKADAIVKNADKRAHEIIQGTTTEARNTLQRLRSEIAESNRTMEALKAKHNEIKTSLRVAYETQLKAVSDLPDFALEPLDKLYEENVDGYEEELTEIAKRYEVPEAEESVRSFVIREKQDAEPEAEPQIAPEEIPLPEPELSLPEEAPQSARNGFRIYMENLDDDADETEDLFPADTAAADTHRKHGKGKK